jgi:hypothetical protein
MTTLKTICCVCHTVLVDGPDEPVSHGYCAKCMRATLRDNGCTWRETEGVMARARICKICKSIKELWRRIW